MTAEKMKVLAVDDEEFNLEILERHLKKAGYDSVAMEDGEKAWEYLEKNPESVDIVLLDKMMPKMNGIELLKKIKKHPSLKDIPVILQTASVGVQEVTEGIQAGAYYYLTKPFAAEMLISIVNAAARDHRQKAELLKKAGHNKAVLELMKTSAYEFRSLEDARGLAAFMANCFPVPSRAIIGLSALLINAVEHGNLELGYAKKTELLNSGKWEDEIKRRLELPEFKNRKVKVTYERGPLEIKVVIKDEGKGFNWKPYMNFEPVRITDPNGRGIAMSNIVKGSKILYNDSGNEVTYTFLLNQQS